MVKLNYKYVVFINTIVTFNKYKNLLRFLEKMNWISQKYQKCSLIEGRRAFFMFGFEVIQD